ncbi:transcriptional antiterminator/mannitol/fructose-specific phosphotransferase system IIA component (Ntr-type) [Enterococcus sp. PF1-24]|uniref:BglG family transcription antiterminator n=1 Tax=unclassified Enterococcus TaxID=2608891 RepID=UPI0024731AB6|nr:MULTISPECIES: PTS sugar transporter subunit IIA [unclassified Enterococcus]MDH6365591.1 transcriptional antiterminator/mannitol/fructose-specific phosphotransferase system IIA component (Ntr-type) [Enterococcus sp. PFB1-1]MDH6402693.1 transcriptional antiterminator/mannitol/fructose-specific phosphotransferase system IIA component (Ntr-type) [Enterococcus sp. PF1-24]
MVVSFDQRTRHMIEQLIEKPFISQEVMVKSLSLSKNQVSYLLDKVNSILENQQQTLLSFDGEKIQLREESRNYFIKMMSDDFIFEHYDLSNIERKKYIYLMLVYYGNEYLSVNHFLDVLKIGKTTFINDMKKLEKDLVPFDISIVYSRKDGYTLAGKEEEIRFYLMRMILEDFSSRERDFLYRFFIGRESQIDKAKILETISQKLEEFSINLVENRLNEFCYMLIFLLPRLHYPWSEFYDKYSLPAFFLMPEYHFAKSLLNEFEITNEHAILYVCGWILGMAIGNEEKETPDYSIISELVERIFHRFEMLSGTRFTERAAAKKQLYRHFRSIYYRLFFHLHIINYLHSTIMNKYAELFQIVKETMKPIETLFGTEIPDEEVSFLTIHFASLLDDYDEYQVNQKVGIIVCPNGIGSSAIVYNELRATFPDMIFMGPVESGEILKVKENFDMIFTTAPNIRLYSLNKPVYLVNPIMTLEEKYRLVQEVNQTGKEMISDYKMDELITILAKYCEIQDENGLRNELYFYLNSKKYEAYPTLAVKKKEDLELLDILKPEFIQLNIKARNWEESFFIAAAPLINADIITRRYIDTIIQTVRKEGPYMVIMNRVALPHARPQDGAKKIGLSIATLDQEVKILGKTPIKYIFTLSAVDNKKHLTAIAELVSLLEKEELFTVLDQSEKPEQVYNWIKANLYN